jgi:hypothetical protein
MKLKANDTLFISSVKSENILPGEEFEVSDAEGKRLIEAGLAAKAKAAPAHQNKMEKPAANKAAKAKGK